MHFQAKDNINKPLKYFPAEQSCCTAWQSAAKSTWILCYMQQCVKYINKSFDAKVMNSFSFVFLLLVLLIEAVNTDLIRAV